MRQIKKYKNQSCAATSCGKYLGAKQPYQLSQSNELMKGNLTNVYRCFNDSCNVWYKTSTRCPNLVPVEIAMRIVDAINRGEDFVAYVVSPLSSVTQNEESDDTHIRDHLKTIRMMYGLIQEALTEANSEKTPSDFLAFLCINRGTKGALHDCAVFDDQYFLLGDFLVPKLWAKVSICLNH